MRGRRKDGKPIASAGRSSLPRQVQERIESLLAMQYGETFIVRYLNLPEVTREKVRTIRLRMDARTHHPSVTDDVKRYTAHEALVEAAQAVVDLYDARERLDEPGALTGAMERLRLALAGVPGVGRELQDGPT